MLNSVREFYREYIIAASLLVLFALVAMIAYHQGRDDITAQYPTYTDMCKKQCSCEQGVERLYIELKCGPDECNLADLAYSSTSDYFCVCNSGARFVNIPK